METVKVQKNFKGYEFHYKKSHDLKFLDYVVKSENNLKIIVINLNVDTFCRIKYAFSKMTWSLSEKSAKE